MKVFLFGLGRLALVLGGLCCSSLSVLSAGEPDARHPLVDLGAVPGLKIELAYASSANCVQRPVYPQDAHAWADPRVAECLEYAAATLAMQGCRLVLLDAYRPPWAVERLWEIGRAMNLDIRYLSNPAGRGSDHSRGAAVDVTMERIDGSPVEMPCRFDEFSEMAWIDCPHVTRLAAANRDLLCLAMEAAGFKVHPEEWWHYVIPEARANPIFFLSLQTGEAAARHSQRAKR
ncbi:MAG: M15 family metallopeptidase [Chthoniobacteraceae bacterium]